MLVVFIGIGIVCTHTYNWERFQGETLGDGVSSIQVTGDSIFEWNGGGASMTRVSTMVAADGYNIELHGLRAYELVGFSTRARPREGTFRVVKNRFDHTTYGEIYTAMMSLSNESFFGSDSGSLTLKQVGTSYDGRYVVYLSGDSASYISRSRHFVVRGTFHVEKRD